VIVFYGPKDIPGEEWIANRPDPRSAKIIWARDMGTVKNEELIRAYPGRHVWFANRSAPWGQLVSRARGISCRSCSSKFWRIFKPARELAAANSGREGSKR
jgi:hypothetical protein